MLVLNFGVYFLTTLVVMEWKTLLVKNFVVADAASHVNEKDRKSVV